jgi:glycosyltransferase involved in cell wall biosynthesis
MLSIIITSLNENNFILNKTIQSIIDTSPKNIEIIVIDDCSDNHVGLESKKVILERNQFRMGVAQSRHFGASIATNKWLLFTDSHMKFAPKWYDNFIEYQKTSIPKTIYNGCCLGLWEGDNIDWDNINLDKLPHYYGAKLELYNKQDNKILEGKWLNLKENKDKDNYEISCLMGAIYFIQKKFFFEIRGLQDLKGWGSDEPLLSLKTLLSGGEIRQLKNVRAAHLFRKTAPYSTPNKHMIYNKIRMAQTLLPEDLGRLLISKLPQTVEFFEAFQLINQENKIIEEYKKYYKSIFIKDIEYINQKFNIGITNE